MSCSCTLYYTSTLGYCFIQDISVDRPLIWSGTAVLIREHYKRVSKLLSNIGTGLSVDDTKNWTDENWTAKSLFSLYMAWNILGGEVANICSTIINTFLVLWKNQAFKLSFCKNIKYMHFHTEEGNFSRSTWN